uniref:AP-5 complex subunit zeta-1 N-terminal TPR domain-containing protein n=1 Tax=Xiphophorus couchianus TaxID=32473 RepID=A0A3B5MHB9_9TELE
MYSLGSESLIKQAREIQETELQKFYSRLVKLLQLKELGHETVDSLQRLHLILSANKYARTLCPQQSWMARCRATSSPCSAWARDSRRTSG